MKRLHGFSEMSALSSMVMLGPSPSTYLLYDTFTDTDNTHLSAHTMDVGSGWTTVDSREWTIKSGVVAADAGSITSPQNVIHANAGQGDVSISLSTQLGGVVGGWYIGACARVTDGNNLWAIAYRTESAAWVLVKRSSGTDTTATTGPIFALGDQNTYRTLTALLRGDVFVVSVNGTVQLTWIDSTYSSNTKFGLAGDRLGINDGSWNRDDFKVIAAPAQTTYVSDGFSGSGSLSGRTPDTVGAGTWTVYSGTWTVGSGTVSKTATTATHERAVYDAGVADCVVQADITLANTNYRSGLILRASDTNNNWWLYADGNLGKMTLWEFNAGSLTSRGEAGCTIDTTTRTAKAVCAGSSISISFNSVTIAYHAASFNNTATKHGIHSYETGNLIDNFSVKSL